MVSPYELVKRSRCICGPDSVPSYMSTSLGSPAAGTIPALPENTGIHYIPRTTISGYRVVSSCSTMGMKGSISL